MSSKSRILILSLLSLPLYLSCNIYTPLSSPSTDEEYLEEARACLHSGDYACAIENYEKLSDGPVKNEKLCIVNIARAGLGLSTLVQTITNNESQDAFLGQLANRLLPTYSEDQLAAAESSITNCALMGTDDTGTLLKTLSYMVDCGNRLAKTDTLVAISDGGTTTCNSTTAGNGDGEVTSVDIGGNALTGALSGGEPGMCAADVQKCLDDLQAANGLGFGGGIGGNLDALPPELIDSSTAVDLARVELRGTLE